VRLLKKLAIVLAAIAAGIIGGGLIGFALGYGITGKEHSNPHGGLILVGMLMFGGALLGLIAGAVAAYRLIQDHPKHVRAMIHRAAVYHQKGEYNRAISEYDEVIKLVPNNDLAYYNRGSAKLKKGDQAGANVDFELAKQLRR
jgi:tetratricopeptide (TPR) repeat protein